MGNMGLLTIPVDTSAEDALVEALKETEVPFWRIQPGTLFIRGQGKTYTLHTKLSQPIPSTSRLDPGDLNAQEMRAGQGFAQVVHIPSDAMVRPVTLDIVAHWTLSTLSQTNENPAA